MEVSRALSVCESKEQPMKEKIEKTFSQVMTSLKETVNDIAESAKNKSGAIIDDWLSVFPELEAMGLEITSFGIGLAISPSLEVELTGSGAAFTEQRLDSLVQEYRENTHVLLVLRAIRTTRKMYVKLGKDVFEEMFIQVKVKVPPEVRVYFGEPKIH